MPSWNLARKLKIDILKSLSPAAKIELCAKESRQLLELNHLYSVLYLRKKFASKATC